MPRASAKLAARSSRAFRGPEQFRAWLERHHHTAAELLVRCFKTNAQGWGLTYRQALEEALCFGWIDGVRRSVDGESFSVRFSPRKPKSRWSAVNVKLATALEATGRLRPPGFQAFRARGPANSAGYSYESRPVALQGPYLTAFQANRRAWAFYQKQAPWYRRVSAYWVMSAKREETREKRLTELIDCSQRELSLHALARSKPGGKKP